MCALHFGERGEEEGGEFILISRGRGTTTFTKTYLRSVDVYNIANT